ncbi:pyrimidine dimer DNA glycosylase/endonuclease V [Candidatus Woesearchaeota archaeon]|nr:pyrimidine dimer DNA glycosylase/endonuclease V [Candidatus Woesearchaeota archaeon]
MVRINLIDPSNLADQHLIAEYNEILMLFGYVRKYPEAVGIPSSYCLGPGHIRFFQDKLLYLKKRHELIKKEMKLRGFRTEKTIKLSEFPRSLCNDWEPQEKDKQKIRGRLIEKLSKKPDYYSYHGEKKGKVFFLNLIRMSK